MSPDCSLASSVAVLDQATSFWRLRGAIFKRSMATRRWGSRDNDEPGPPTGEQLQSQVRRLQIQVEQVAVEVQRLQQLAVELQSALGSSSSRPTTVAIAPPAHPPPTSGPTPVPPPAVTTLALARGGPRDPTSSEASAASASHVMVLPPPPPPEAPPKARPPRPCGHRGPGRAGNTMVRCDWGNQCQSSRDVDTLFQHLSATLFRGDLTDFNDLWWRVDEELQSGRIEVDWGATPANRFVLLRCTVCKAQVVAAHGWNGSPQSEYPALRRQLLTWFQNPSVVDDASYVQAVTTV